MRKEFLIEVKLNSSTHFYEVKTDLDKLNPNASTIVANCINCRERSYNPNSDKLKEIEVAIYNGLYKLGINGIFHCCPCGQEDGIIKRLIGGIGI